MLKWSKTRNSAFLKQSCRSYMLLSATLTKLSQGNKSSATIFSTPVTPQCHTRSPEQETQALGLRCKKGRTGVGEETWTLPSFHFSEVKCDLSVGHSLLVQVAAVPPDERRHIVAYVRNQRRDEWVETTYRREAAVDVCEIPWRPLLSKKLLRLKSVFLEARYCINLCKKTTHVMNRECLQQRRTPTDTRSPSQI